MIVFIDLPTPDSFTQFIQTQTVALIEYTTEWCIPCKKLKKHLMSRQGEYNLVIGVVNCDVNKEICNTLKIEYVPTLQLWVNGEPRLQVIGYEKNKVNTILKVTTQVASDEETLKALLKILEYAEKNNLMINHKLLPIVLEFKGRKCPCRPLVTQCPCPDAQQHIKQKGRCYCGLFKKH